jgi:hypothetical protein
LELDESKEEILRVAVPILNVPPQRRNLLQPFKGNFPVVAQVEPRLATKGVPTEVANLAPPCPLETRFSNGLASRIPGCWRFDNRHDTLVMKHYQTLSDHNQINLTEN